MVPFQMEYIEHLLKTQNYKDVVNAVFCEENKTAIPLYLSQYPGEKTNPNLIKALEGNEFGLQYLGRELNVFEIQDVIFHIIAPYLEIDDATFTQMVVAGLLFKVHFFASKWKKDYFFTPNTYICSVPMLSLFVKQFGKDEELLQTALLLQRIDVIDFIVKPEKKWIEYCIENNVVKSLQRLLQFEKLDVKKYIRFAMNTYCDPEIVDILLANAASIPSTIELTSLAIKKKAWDCLGVLIKHKVPFDKEYFQKEVPLHIRQQIYKKLV
jgi:hypothetical protein